MGTMVPVGWFGSKTHRGTGFLQSHHVVVCPPRDSDQATGQGTKKLVVCILMNYAAMGDGIHYVNDDINNNYPYIFRETPRVNSQVHAAL